MISDAAKSGPEYTRKATTNAKTQNQCVIMLTIEKKWTISHVLEERIEGWPSTFARHCNALEEALSIQKAVSQPYHKGGTGNVEGRYRAGGNKKHV